MAQKTPVRGSVNDNEIGKTFGDSELPRSDPGFRAHLTQRANLKHTRYGWLRLTPAYSVHLVDDLLARQPLGKGLVLDPFCGTGTTALVCAQRGIQVHTLDINPFLIWLARTKCGAYSTSDLKQFARAAGKVLRQALDQSGDLWVPSIHGIQKWWDMPTVSRLGRAMMTLRESKSSGGVIDLLKVVFCRVMIESAHVSFGHQSMSFKGQEELSGETESQFAARWEQASREVRDAAAAPVAATPEVFLGDARRLDAIFTHDKYSCVITSPPYPNRMSYIRELRPYMYWLGFLTSGRQAGELDWEAIGGTWGCATSKLQRWRPPAQISIPFEGFHALVHAISLRSAVLGAYVHKYFHDMWEHVRSLYRVVQAGGRIHYIVGNSKFYDVLLPAEEIFAALFREAGFKNVAVETLRKRTSKRELFEYLVSAEKPEAR